MSEKVWKINQKCIFSTYVSTPQFSVLCLSVGRRRPRATSGFLGRRSSKIGKLRSRSWLGRVQQSCAAEKTSGGGSGFRVWFLGTDEDRSGGDWGKSHQVIEAVLLCEADRTEDAQRQDIRFGNLQIDRVGRK